MYIPELQKIVNEYNDFLKQTNRIVKAKMIKIY